MAISSARRLRFAPVALFALVAVGFGFALRNDPHKMPSTLIDRPVPSFELPPVVPGAAALSSRELSGRVVLLNVFASWCPQCRVEHPTLLRLAADGAVPLYGLNWKDKPGAGLSWLEAHRNPYLKVGDDVTGRLGIDLGVTGVPETFVIDSTGRIRYRHAGPITEAVWKETFAPLLASLDGRR